MKKLLYIIMILVVAFFIYDAYFSKIEDLPEHLFENKIYSLNVKYNLEGRGKIEALKEMHYENYVKFFTVKVLMKDGTITSKIGYYYKNNGDTILEDDVVGKNKKGWEFTAKKVKYNQRSRKFTTREMLTCFNEKDKVKVKTKYLDSNSFGEDAILKKQDNFSPMLEKEGSSIKADLITYKKSTKKIKFEKNVECNVKKLDLDNQKLNRDIVCKANEGEFDTKTNFFSLKGDVKILYEGATLYCKKLTYDQNIKRGHLIDVEKIVYKGITIYTNDITFLQDKKIIVINGPIRGEKGKYRFKGKDGQMDLNTKELTINGPIDGYNDDYTMVADKAIYKENNVEFIGNVKIDSKDKKLSLMTPSLNYNLKTNTIKIDTTYNYKYKDISGSGQTLIYNTKSYQGEIDNIDATDFKKNHIDSKKLKFNTQKKEYIFTDKVNAEYKKYILHTDKLILNNEQKIVLIPENFEIDTIDGSKKITGIDLIYNHNTQILDVAQDVHFISNNYDFYCDSCIYDVKKDEMNCFGNIKLKNEKENVTGYADKLYYKDKIAHLVGNIELNRNGYELYTHDIDYHTKTSIAKLESPGVISNPKKQFYLKYQSGTFDNISGILKTNTVFGYDKDADFEGDYGYYDSKKNIMSLKKNAILKKQGIDVKGERIDYNVKKNEYFSNEEVDIYYSGMFINAKKSQINFDKEIITANDSTLVTQNKDEIKSKIAYGYMKKEEFDFSGGVDGIISKKSMEEYYATKTGKENLGFYKENKDFLKKYKKNKSLNKKTSNVQSGADDNNSKLNKPNFSGGNFSGAIFKSGAMITSGFNVSGSDLSGAAISGANTEDVGATFKGERATILFKKNMDPVTLKEKIIPYRGELFENAHFKYKEFDMASNYIEFNLIDEILFGKGKVILQAIHETNKKVEQDLNEKSGSDLETSGGQNLENATSGENINEEENPDKVDELSESGVSEEISGGLESGADEDMSGSEFMSGTNLKTSSTKFDDKLRTETVSDTLELDLSTKIATLRHNVKITNKNDVAGMINITCDEAEVMFDNKKINLKGKAIIYKGANTIQGDNGVVNMVTNELSGKGHLKMKLNFNLDKYKEKEKQGENIVEEKEKIKEEKTKPENEEQKKENNESDESEDDATEIK